MALGKILLCWARYGAGQDMVLGKIRHWARYGTGQDIALLGKTSLGTICAKNSHWAIYRAAQIIELGKIWRWARNCAGQEITLGKISGWTKNSNSARYRAEQDMALARYGTGQDITLGKISHWARY